MRWWESVSEALNRLGGTATLRQIYEKVREVRLEHGDTLPSSLEEVVRKELEYNSRDSTNWRGTRDIFYSVEGIGKGVWGLRSALTIEPQASDIQPPPETNAAGRREEVLITRVVRDTLMSRKVKALHRSRCQICGTTIILQDGRAYAEAHHIIPLGSPHLGPDTPSNIIVVCPNHHAMLDLGCIPLDLEELTTAEGHLIAPQSIEYHNTYIVTKVPIPLPAVGGTQPSSDTHQD